MFHLPIQIDPIAILLFTNRTIELFTTIPTMLISLYLTFYLRMDIFIKAFCELLYSTTLQSLLLQLILKASLSLL